MYECSLMISMPLVSFAVWKALFPMYEYWLIGFFKHCRFLTCSQLNTYSVCTG
jgi:hypothetical protein